MKQHSFIIIFQSTLPRGSDMLTPLMLRPIPLFQSTLPRGSDKACTCWRFYSRISIHAPSRERRTTTRRAFIPTLFQSTLPRGSDYSPHFLKPRPRRFQSTLPRGSDYEIDARGGTRYTISIHAPSRERPAVKTAILTAAKFQSTLPRGSDV